VRPSARPEAIETEYGPAPEPVTVAVGGDPLEAVTVAATVTEADHDPIEVLPRAVVPEASDTGTGGMGAVRSGPLPPPPPAAAPIE
jgi:hypothetical protein